MKALVISIAGIGNTLMATPLISALAAKGKDVHVLVAHGPTKDILKDNKDVRKVHTLKKKWQKDLPFNLQSMQAIRKEKFDESYMVFPGNRWFFNAVSFMTGAKKRYAHRYPNNKLTSFSFLNNRLTDMKEIHDVHQNLQLLPFDVDAVSLTEPVYNIEKKKIIGFHPGSSVHSNMLMKRWPEKYYAEVINNIEGDVRVFIGPDEEESFSALKKHLTRDVEEVRGLPLYDVCKKIAECHQFVSNDSGLMHIAAAFDIPVIGIFGPTDPRRNAPFNSKAKVLQYKMSCQPCNHSFHNLGQHKNCVHPERYCLTRLLPKDVLQAIKENSAKGL